MLDTAFPILDLPASLNPNWTMIHAIARQESQFDESIASSANAQGLMQLLPSTAAEQAGKLGLPANTARLTQDPIYNVTLGGSFFARLKNNYGGSHVLAVAAYNAGPGNVNKWLRRNGDPRNGSIDWVTWVEKIPIFETKNYVQRVIENAAVYEQLYPQNSELGRPRSAGEFLR